MGLKSKIKANFMGELLISEYHRISCWLLPRIVSDEKAIRKYYKKNFGKELDLLHPQTFAEKINWYKLNSTNPLMTQCADKVGVRDYVSKKGYSDCLNTVYSIYDSVDEVDLAALPQRFVMKAAHGSHMAFIVKEKENFHWGKAKILLKSWLHQDIYWSGREWVYKDIPKRIIVEEYLEDESGELKDFKFFCFHGNPTYMEYDTGRFGEKHYRTYYDMQMNLMGFVDKDCPNRLMNVDFPLSREVYQKMQMIARDLAQPFQQVRVDFYFVNKKIYVGELTFFDGGGSTVFEPDEWNCRFSENWHIEKTN